jgi:hypothetical protein
MRLQRLELLGVDAEEAYQLATPLTDSLFLASMPRLKVLVYRGNGHDSSEHSTRPIFGTNFFPPALARFDFADVTITEPALIAVFEEFARSLERLFFDHIKPSTGTWRNVFAMILDRLPSLKYALFTELTEGDNEVTFCNIIERKPCVWDADYYRVHQGRLEVVARKNVQDIYPRSIEKLSFASVVEEIENGYAWVSSGGGFEDSVTVKLDAAEDGDLKPWLELGRDEHELW